MLRTASNRRQCAFLGCTHTDHLHDVSRSLRLEALKNRVYIPNRTRVCARHESEYVWNNFQGKDRRSKFTTKQVNEMVHSLCDSIDVYNSPGEFSIIYLLIFNLYQNCMRTLFLTFRCTI